MPTPEKGAEIARNVVIENFPIKNIEFKSYRILNHQYLEITLEGEDGKAIVKLEGERGEVLDYSVEISEKVASELVRNKYAGSQIGSERFLLSLSLLISFLDHAK